MLGRRQTLEVKFAETASSVTLSFDLEVDALRGAGFSGAVNRRDL